MIIAMNEMMNNGDAIQFISVYACSQREYWSGFGAVDDVYGDVSRIASRTISEFK
jgi:hypothetical protein